MGRQFTLEEQRRGGKVRQRLLRDKNARRNNWIRAAYRGGIPVDTIANRVGLSLSQISRITRGIPKPIA